MSAPVDINAYAAALARKKARAVARPSTLYKPGRLIDIWGKPVAPEDNGQLQFHMAPHEIRSASPGNGWGKTQISTIEVDWWGHGDHPWPHDMPERALQMVWICKKLQQWELLKKVVHPWWPKNVTETWRGQPFNDYRWPNGSTLTVLSDQTDRTTIAGIEPDLVVADEEFDVRIANEIRLRRRGKTRTRFIFNGTATEGLTWVSQQVYMPWKQFHEKLGITDEREMMRRQLHDFGDDFPSLKGVPGIWCWPKGCHADNPTATIQTWERQQATVRHYPKVEREVRLYGGYRDYNGSPVFDQEALALMRADLRAGEPGWYVVKESAGEN